MEREVEIAKDLNAFELVTRGGWSSRMAARLEATCQWQEVRRCLEYLSELGSVKGLEFIGIEARYHLAKIGKEYRTDQARLREKHRRQLQVIVTLWEARLLGMSKRWVLWQLEPDMDSSGAVDGVQTLLNEKLVKTLKPFERQGLSEAASCLMHGNWTSAEYLSLRIAASVLGRWYTGMTGNKLKASKWGEMLDRLDRGFPKAERPKELAPLEYFRRRRDRIANPQAVSTQKQANKTFMNVAEAIKAVSG